MKRLIIVLILLCMIPPAVYAGTKFYNKYQYNLSEEAIQAATDCEIPSTLSEEEHDIFRLGYAFGWDKANNTTGRFRTIPLEPTYIANKASMKFHLPSCYMVNAILLDNRVDLFDDYADVILQGYTPCGKCLNDAKTEKTAP